MNLRLKVLIILASVWALISAVTFTYSKQVLTEEYTKLEIHEMKEDLGRTTRTFKTLLSTLKTLNSDWAQWNDAYQFMKDKNDNFIRSNMAFTTFENAKINLILFFDTSGKLFYGMNYDLVNKKFIPIPPELVSLLESEKSFTRQRNTESGKSGLLQFNNEYLALSAFPIVTSDGTGPIRGTLMMGFMVNEAHLLQLADIVKMDVELHSLPTARTDSKLLPIYDHLRSGDKTYTQINSATSITGYTFIRDIEDNPIGLLSLTVPRPVYQEGMKTIGKYLAINILVGVFFLMTVWYLLKIFVLDRVIRVSQDVIDIASKSTFSKRIETSGHDELSNMTMAINSLLEIIAITEEKLKSRISLRSEELERLLQLNKNLYTEMTNQKQIEVKLREGEKRLHHMAYYDALTGMPNRVNFNEQTERRLEIAKASETKIAIVFIDADKFKQINDTYGHEMGDRFLRHVAEQLKASTNNDDIVSRLSGDEFLLCLTDAADKNNIIKATNRILEHLSVPLKTEIGEISSTFSIGIAIYPSDGETLSTLEKNADLAMYYAKKQLNSGYCFYAEIKKEEADNQ